VVLALVVMSSNLQWEAEVDWMDWLIDDLVAEPLEQRNHSTFHFADLETVLEEHSRCRSQAVEGMGCLVVEDHVEWSNNRYDHLQSLVERIRRKDQGRRQ